MLDLIIKNGQCYIDGELKDVNVSIKDGKIQSIGKISEDKLNAFNITIDEIKRAIQQENIKNRFCVAYHLLSITKNMRIRIKVYLEKEPLIIPSVTKLWSSADWYEREAFDLFGILFEGHPDLRRLLTDYGFIGYPFRKDFPLIGNIQIRYDPELKKIIQEPVDIQPRVLVPKVIRGNKE